MPILRLCPGDKSRYYTCTWKDGSDKKADIDSLTAVKATRPVCMINLVIKQSSAIPQSHKILRAAMHHATLATEPCKIRHGALDYMYMM